MSDLTAEAGDVVLGWLVAGMMHATVNTEAEREAYQYVVSGRAERALAASPSGTDTPKCDDDHYCGECPDCLTGEHPENRSRVEP